MTHSDHVADHPTPLEARSSGPLIGKVRVPGDKSISHRALILGALAVGETRVSGLLEGEDVLNTAKAMRTLGAWVERTGEFAWSVRGVGVAGFAQPQAPLDFGNSGTGCRLVMGAVAGCPITAVFDGDASLRGRPMRRVLDPLELMGARVGASGDGGRLPLTLNGARDPLPIHYRTPVASAQIKSAVLLAGLAAPGTTTVIESEASRDHTELMLKHFGAEITSTAEGAHGRRITLTTREYALLEYFLRNVGRVLSRPMIAQHVWGLDFDPESNIIDVYVGYLRRKIDGEGEHRLLHTMRGAGYVMRMDAA